VSGIAGAFSFQQPAPDSALVRAMLDSMSRGTDDVGITCSGAVVIGHRVRWTTDEGRRERQPLQSSDGRVQLVYDGRVDNREELVAHLQVPSDTSDGALLVEIIAREGPDALARCVGEFALSWWRDDGTELGLARDSLGMRPLYYAVTPQGLVWASELQALFVPGWVVRRVNEGFIAEFLAMVPHSIDETPFEGVHRLPQAHLLLVDGTRVAARRYWSPSVVRERRSSDQEEIDEFRSLLTLSVKSCLRATKPVAFQLSGGIDSTSVLALGRALGVTEPAAFSMVFPGDPRTDESAFIDEAARFMGAKQFRVIPDTTDADPFRYVRPHEDLPYHPVSEPLMGQLVAQAASEGYGVMLTGAGADEWLTLSLSRMAALLRRGRVLAFARYLRDVRADYAEDWEWRLLFGAGLLPLIPERIKSLARPWVARGRRDGAPWITADLAGKTALDQRLRASFRRAPRAGDPVVQESLVRVASGEEAAIRQDAERMGTHAGVELRHPYYDRRLVEWLLALPDDLRFRERQSKYISRMALAGLMPPAILQRRDKGDFTNPMLRIMLAAYRRTDWRHLRVVERGWVDAGVVAEFERTLNATGTGEYAREHAALALWHVAALEDWFRRAFP
jgi:asparagine synthase (glutamine-hydrolysing)